MRCCISGNSLLKLTLMVALTSLCGCATLGWPGSKTATVEALYDDYDQAEVQMEATQDALHELRTTPVQDLGQAIYTLRKSSGMMDVYGKRLVAHADALHFNGASYLVEAEKTGAACVFPPGRGEVMNPAELGPLLDPIEEATWEVKHAYRAYQFDLSSIDDYMCSNPHPVAVDSLTFLFRKADVDSANLEDALERAIAVLDQAKTVKARAARQGGS